MTGCLINRRGRCVARLSFALLSIGALLPLGCGGRQQLRQEVLADQFSGEARDLGLRIYQLESRIERLEDRPIHSARRTETDSGNRDVRPDSGEPEFEFDESNLGLPDVEVGPPDGEARNSPGRFNFDPWRPQGSGLAETRRDRELEVAQRGRSAQNHLAQNGPAQNGPAPDRRVAVDREADSAAAPDRGVFEDLASVPRSDPSNVDPEIVSRIQIGNSSGSRDFDGQDGDDGMSIIVQPIDHRGEILAVPGPVSIVLLDARNRERVARWEYSEAEVQEAFVADGSGVGFRLDMSWAGMEPRSTDLHVYVRFRGAGGEWDADLPMKAKLAVGRLSLRERTLGEHAAGRETAGRETAGRETAGREIAVHDPVFGGSAGLLDSGSSAERRPSGSRAGEVQLNHGLSGGAGWAPRTGESPSSAVEARVDPSPVQRDVHQRSDDAGPTASVYDSHPSSAGQAADSSDSPLEWRSTR
jgi:hypothetical protein